MQLLLATQKVCNVDGYNIDWEAVGVLLAEGNGGLPISSSAILQHLGKIRLRRQEAGLWVPAPLRRGGNNRGAGSRRTAPTYLQGTPRSNNRGNPSSGKRTIHEDSSDDGDFTKFSNSDESYGKTRNSKRVKKEEKKNLKKGTQTIKEEADEADEDTQAEKKIKAHGKKGDNVKKTKHSKVKHESGSNDDEFKDGYVGIGAPYMKLEGNAQSSSSTSLTDQSSVMDIKRENGGLTTLAPSKCIVLKTLRIKPWY